MSVVADKVTITIGAATTAVASGKSISKADSLFTGFLDSSVSEILAGNFTWYGSDIIALTSVVATLALLTWRIYFDKKTSNRFNIT
jgi:hypothetical protein